MKAILLAVLFLLPSGFVSAQVDQSSAAKQELTLGVQAYRAADYEGAIQHFERAAKLDPSSSVAYLYLATTYAQQYVPGVDTPENLANAKSAQKQYAEVLKRDPENMLAVKGTAYLNWQLKKFKEAIDGYKRAAEMDPNDPESFYSAGVVDWSLAYRGLADVKAKLAHSSGTSDADDDDSDDDDSAKEKPKSNSDPEYALIFSPLCANLRAEHLPEIEDGMARLTRAIDLRKNYDDAMVYLNLLFRLRADLQCGNRAAHDSDVKKANDWSAEAMAARKRKADAAAKNQQDPAGAPPQ